VDSQQFCGCSARYTAMNCIVLLLNRGLRSQSEKSVLVYNFADTHAVLATGPGNPPAVRFLAGGSVRFCLVRYLAKNLNRYVLAGLLPRPDRNPVFFGRVGTGPRVHFAVPTFLAPIKYLSSDRIMPRCMRRFRSFSRSFTSCFQICDPTNIR
jgi:hypothetical protein